MKTFAEEMIVAVTRTGNELATATCNEMMIELDRPAAKSAAIQRLMELENPETKKQHPGSSVEKAVETDAEYYAYVEKKIESVRATIIARSAYDSAKLTAQLAVSLVASGSTGDSIGKAA